MGRLEIRESSKSLYTRRKPFLIMNLHISWLPQLITTPAHDYPSSWLPQLMTTPAHHYPRSSLPQVITTPAHHYPRSSLPQVITTPGHHYPRSSLPQLITTPGHHYPSPSLPQPITTPAHDYLSSSQPQVITTPGHHYLSSSLPQLKGCVCLFQRSLWFAKLMITYIICSEGSLPALWWLRSHLKGRKRLLSMKKAPLSRSRRCMLVQVPVRVKKARKVISLLSVSWDTHIQPLECSVYLQQKLPLENEFLKCVCHWPCCARTHCHQQRAKESATAISTCTAAGWIGCTGLTSTPDKSGHEPPWSHRCASRCMVGRAAGDKKVQQPL